MSLDIGNPGGASQNLLGKALPWGYFQFSDPLVV
jgi:hypothetical protein